MDADPDYVAAFARAKDHAADLLEQEARRRAHDGIQRKKFDRGVPLMDPETGKQYVEHEYSDTLLIFLLKGVRPDVYRENVKIDATTRGDLRIENGSPDLSRLTLDEMRALKQLQEKATAGPAPLPALEHAVHPE